VPESTIGLRGAVQLLDELASLLRQMLRLIEGGVPSDAPADELIAPYVPEVTASPGRESHPDCRDDRAGVPGNAYYEKGRTMLDEARQSNLAKNELQEGLKRSVRLSDLLQPSSPDDDEQADIDRTKLILDSADPDEARVVLDAVWHALETKTPIEYLCSIRDTEEVIKTYGGPGKTMIHFHVHQGDTSTTIVAAPGPPAHP